MDQTCQELTYLSRGENLDGGFQHSTQYSAITLLLSIPPALHSVPLSYHQHRNHSLGVQNPFIELFLQSLSPCVGHLDFDFTYAFSLFLLLFNLLLHLRDSERRRNRICEYVKTTGFHLDCSNGRIQECRTSSKLCTGLFSM